MHLMNASGYTHHLSHRSDRQVARLEKAYRLLTGIKLSIAAVNTIDIAISLQYYPNV